MTFVDIGIFKDPIDTAASFVAIQNRRLWIDTNITGAKRKIDYRTIFLSTR